jgi:hypothetical protein
MPLRRIVALSVVIALSAAPLASAQSPEAAQPSAAPSNTTLLSPAAFARLLQPPPDIAPVPVVKVTPRLDPLRPPMTAVAREARAMTAKPPQQQSWVSRHKKMLRRISVGAGVFFGIWSLWYLCADACHPE